MIELDNITPRGRGRGRGKTTNEERREVPMAIPPSVIPSAVSNPSPATSKGRGRGRRPIFHGGEAQPASTLIETGITKANPQEEADLAPAKKRYYVVDKGEKKIGIMSNIRLTPEFIEKQKAELERNYVIIKVKA